MKIAIVSLFPELIEPFSRLGVTGRAVARHLAELTTIDPRSYADDAHGTVDDRPYGGGPGMVIKVEPYASAIEAARSVVRVGSPVIFLTPQGRRFDQATARRYASLAGFVLVAGRYEGFDERLLQATCDEELSIGDFVLSGGEIAALAVADSVLRLLPGVLGDDRSAGEDSFSDGLLDCPHFTRPETVGGRDVPAVLLGGNHAEIRRWRRREALGRTLERRPDLLAGRRLAWQDQQLLAEYLAQAVHGDETQVPAQRVPE